MILALLAVLQASPADSLPRVTLAEALAQGVRLDPDYVRALGTIGPAEWSRRAALITLVVPSVTASSDFSFFSIDQFNIGTGQQARRNASARIDARLEIFTGGRKLAELSRARAELEGAQANEVLTRYLSALFIEENYYDVLGGRELLDVAQGRLRRAEEGLAVARARVVSGAAVQSDSLQLVLERNNAQVARLRAEVALRSARLDLGRRIGRRGAVDAVALDTLPVPDLPLSLPDLVTLALQVGPEYRVARANEGQADAILRARRGSYLPTLALSGSVSSFDENWFPNALTRRTGVISLSLPLWDNGQRELNLARARASRDVARAVREDLERGVEADVTLAYDSFVTARATLELDRSGLTVARENFRVQETRYRAGATTILDLLAAQDQLTSAEANVVRSRYATRLAVAGLEAVLGRRLLNDRTEP
ncbi:MAG TPA: TolC family protein [Gemmatimonadales bacterium]